MRGRPFGFIGLLCSVWIATRVGVISLVTHGTGATVLPSKATERPPEVTVQQPSKPVAAAQRTLKGFFPEPPVARAAFANGKAVYAGQSEPVFSGMLQAEPFGPPLPAGPIFLVPPPALHDSGKSSKPASRLSIYAYSFWRAGAPTPGSLGNGQYGGGQSAVIAAYALPRLGRDAFDIMARAAIAHDNSKEREFAAGVRWRPTQRLPVQFTAERRFRHGRADAFAAYAAGGTSDIGLPMGFKLDGYAQAGYVSGDGGGLFADFNARAERKLVQIENTVMSGGIGFWGGGQRDVMRVDVGPTVRADMAVGQAQVRLSADWRFRVAGNAAPGNGPALTLSTSF